MKNKIIVVSGAASGIGAAIFCHLLATDNIPIGIDIKPLKGSELEGLTKKRKRRAEFYLGDASNHSDMTAIFRGIKKVDGLVNSAGIMGGDNSHNGRYVPSFQKLIRHNAQTAFVLTELCHPIMPKGGSIVNIGSIDLDMIMPEAVCYAASKGALWGLTLGYAVTLARKRIRVNMVSPGSVATKKELAQYEKSPEILKGFADKTPLKRLVEPSEVASTVAFLLSEQSSAITGQNIVVNCGFTRTSWDPSWTKKDLAKVFE